MTDAPAFEGWALVEIMGHRRRAGFVREVTVAGAKMLQVDVPAPDGDVTEFYGGASIFALRPVTEQLARDLAKQAEPRPVRALSYACEDDIDG
ncbi:MAG: hypothetical protein NW200_12480 [Hyphomonadaceae bacterium]|nr:hypothetical protein [Hyphomonadaceae bacterium]